MRTLSRKSFAIGLLVALLVTYTGRAIPVFALADPVQAIAPIFDTEIIQLQNYIDNGGMTDPQLDIFYFLAGALVAGQLGAQDAKLVSPYPNETNVKEWLINCGIQLYNSLIGLVPSGDYYVGIDYPTQGISRQQMKALVAMLMGDAVVAANYPNLDNYLAENPDHLYIPFNPDLQLGVNAIFGLSGGAYQWQIEDKPFQFPFTWKQSNLGQLADAYNAALANLTNNRYFANTYSNDVTNLIISPVNDYEFSFFINTSSGQVQLYCNNTYYSQLEFKYVCVRNGQVSAGTAICSNTYNYINLANFNSYAAIVNEILNNPSAYRFMNFYVASDIYLCWPAYTQIIDHYYAGPSWSSKEAITNLSDLNFEVDQTQYYLQLADNYLLDLRGLMSDLVNYVYVRQPVWDNIYLPDGTLTIPDVINVSVDLTPITNLLAPAIPVNLNDIAEYTDNSYLERIKEEAQRGGNALAYLVAFWHNCDAELIYLMFGAGITVLVGAFIGKWGHS